MKKGPNQIEIYAEWFFNQLIDYGYLKSYKTQPEKMNVVQPAKYGRMKRFKTKSAVVDEYNLLPAIHYGADYELEWHPNAEYLFFEEINQAGVFQFGTPPFVAHRIPSVDVNSEDRIVSWIDIKPTNSVMRRGGNVSSSISFTYKRRMLWDNHRIFINKSVPIPMAGTGHTIAMFTTMFTPDRYLLTDGGRQRRKIKWKIVSLKEYVVRRKKEIEDILKKSYNPNEKAKNKS